MADLTKGLLNLNITPEQARLLDRQAREQQIQQQTQATPDLFRGMLQQAMRTADTLQNIPRALTGGRAPMGVNELEQQRKAKLIKEAQDKQEMRKGLATAEISTLVKQKMASGDISKEEGTALVRQVAQGLTSFEDARNRLGVTVDEGDWKALGDNKTIYNTKSGEKKVIGNTSDYPNLSSKDIMDMIDTYTTDSVEKWKATVTAKNPSGNVSLLEKIEPSKDSGELTDVGKLAFKDAQSMLEKSDIDGTITTLNILNEQSRILKSEEGIISGFGADALKQISSLGRQMGVLDDKQATRLASTEVYNSNAGVLVGQVIKLFGSGTGLSDADRQYAKQIAAGELTMGKISMARVLDIMQRSAISKIERHNEIAKYLADTAGEGAGKIYEARIQDVPVFVRNDLSTTDKITLNNKSYYIDEFKMGSKTYKEMYNSEGVLVRRMVDGKEVEL